MLDRHFALIGYPLGHSVSPQVHARLFELSGKQANYSLFEIAPEDFDLLVEKTRQLNGFNVTIPYKTRIIEKLDQLDDTARRYGSVNTVQCGEKRIGYNTDVDGFLKGAKRCGADLSGNVLLCGSGGTGRMMAIETALRGGALTIAARESGVDRALQLKSEVLEKKPDARVRVQMYERIEGHFDVLLNATPVGMYPVVDDMPVSGKILSSIPSVFDAVYNPSETMLLKKARANGSRTANGMSMLVWQAVRAHEIWDGDQYTEDQIEVVIEEMNAYVQKFFV